MDDIFLHAATKEQLVTIEKKVMKRITEAGFTLNKSKCEFGKTSMKFLGHIFTENGYKADNDKIKAIQQLKSPNNVKELQRILGMVNYIGKFICNLSELTEPLRKLLLKGTAWVWEDEHKQAFEKIKVALTTTPVLAYYDVNQRVKLSVDASSKSMGICLMQNDKPVAYATRAFNKSQQNHPQIVKEALAIRFGCTEFHEYVYGKNLVIETDHKPLETIFKNPIHQAPLRLQRILWDVIEYSPKIEYIKGSKIPIADTLSRDCECEDVETESNFSVNSIVSMSMTDEVRNRFIEETQNDPDLQALKSVVLSGWPANDKKLQESIKKYATFKREITFDGGLLFKANKIIVPKNEIVNLLPQIHSGHIGVSNSLSRKHNGRIRLSQF